MNIVGYSTSHKGYKCMDPTTNRIYISRHIIFYELTLSFVETVTPHASHLLHMGQRYLLSQIQEGGRSQKLIRQIWPESQVTQTVKSQPQSLSTTPISTIGINNMMHFNNLHYINCLKRLLPLLNKPPLTPQPEPSFPSHVLDISQQPDASHQSSNAQSVHTNLTQAPDIEKISSQQTPIAFDEQPDEKHILTDAHRSCQAQQLPLASSYPISRRPLNPWSNFLCTPACL